MSRLSLFCKFNCARLTGAFIDNRNYEKNHGSKQYIRSLAVPRMWVGDVDLGDGDDRYISTCPVRIYLRHFGFPLLISAKPT